MIYKNCYKKKKSAMEFQSRDGTQKGKVKEVAFKNGLGVGWGAGGLLRCDRWRWEIV